MVGIDFVFFTERPHRRFPMDEITLANERLKVIILPEIGGRIENFIDIETGKDWVWHPDGYVKGERRLPVGAGFDENWTGGWDEVFPNDAACIFRGNSLVDHGELWSQSWQVMEESRLAVRMCYECETVPVAVEKIVWLDRRKPHLCIDYAFDNLSNDRLPFLFKLHAALAIEAEDEIVMPSSMTRPVDLGFSTIVAKSEKTPFPKALGRNGDQIILDRILPREANQQEFLYVTDLGRGTCGLRNTKTSRNLRMAFNKSDIPYVWLFQSYGRWKGHYVMVMEPCTNVPYDLATAYESGTCAVLNPQSRRELNLSIGISTRQ